MDWTNNTADPNRNKWQFTYPAHELAAAAATKKAHRLERQKWWEDRKIELMDAARTEGLVIDESLASSYSSNAGRAPQFVVKKDLQTKLGEAHSKILEHANAAREYDGWVQILSAQPPAATLRLKQADWLYFFGAN